MMKRFLYFFILCCVAIACNQKQQSTVTVSGNIKNATHQKIVLLSFDSSNTAIILDSSVVDIKGNYQLKSLSNAEELYAIKVDAQPEIWLVNDAAEITINADVKNYKSYQVKGSQASLQLHHFIAEFDSLQSIKSNLNTAIDTLTKQKAKDSLLNVQRQQLKQTDKIIKEYCVNFYNSSKSPATKYFCLFYAFKTSAIAESELYRMATAASADYANNYQLKGLKSAIGKVVKTNPKIFLVNEAAIDFTYKDTANAALTLKTFAGKYLLLNFWSVASLGNKNNSTALLSLYKQHKEKGFEILGIALDSNKTAWKKTIAKDSLLWRQALDTLLLQSPTAQKYYVDSLPYNILINPSGKIIAVNLKDEELKERLKELFR